MRVRVGERLLAGRVQVADSFGPRLLGLMFRRRLDAQEGLLLRPCNSVHTFFMRFPIDVVYLDRDGQVLRVTPAMAPWRVGPLVRGAKQVLELPAGGAAGLAAGARLAMEG